jgi:pyruvate/2-oxoglutarate dehydrogenase complex dihydrolipoamide dehydrogenase (E3) component
MAASPSFKGDMKRFLDWMTQKTLLAPVEVKLSTEATTESISGKNPDVVIIAVGAEPIIPDIPGIERFNVVWAGDVDIGNAETGERVVVAGAGLTGCETALHLSRMGKRITIIDILPETQIAEGSTLVGKIALMDLLEQQNVVFMTEVKLEEIIEKGVLVIDKTGKRIELSADSVVLSLGVKPREEVVNAFQDSAQDVYIIGDCSKPGNLMSAIHDGFNIAMEIGL